MNKQFGMLTSMSVLVGCFLNSPDLISRGDYRLEINESNICKIAVTAKGTNGRFTVNVRRKTIPRYFPPTAGVEVVLVDSDGNVWDKQEARFHLGCKHRTLRANPYYEAVFAKIPPPGSLIRIRHGLCPSSSNAG